MFKINKYMKKKIYTSTFKVKKINKFVYLLLKKKEVAQITFLRFLLITNYLQTLKPYKLSFIFSKHYKLSLEFSIVI